MMETEKYRLVVASGPTREWIDPVRFITNPSSGKTGWAIASLGRTMFRETSYISGPGKEEYRTVKGATNIHVETTAEMAKEVFHSISDYTILFMAAAPADFTPVRHSTIKIKKRYRRSLNVKLKPTTDILLSAGTKYTHLDHFYKVGFAAETDNVLEHALEKVKRKKCDYVCANIVFKEDKGFGEHENSLMIVDKKGITMTIGPFNKDVLAGKLLDFIVRSIV